METRRESTVDLTGSDQAAVDAAPGAIRVLHVIFKTHLDIGFTDLASVVVDRYMHDYIPSALRLARELRERGGEERFVWTTGSWLIYAYLEQADGPARGAMEAGIAAGDIRWHALPFTFHTESLPADLFRHGLRFSRELDRRFGKRTIAAKMTDVPGHTRGIVPLLAEAGVRFLHIGVNPASRAPAVPDLFRWRDAATDTEIVVMYHKGSYGADRIVEGLDEGLTFAHTGDNMGPPPPAGIDEQYARLRARFPGVALHASTLDAFARALEPIVPSLPVITGELGDTWIHGIGTDPAKMAAFRALARFYTRAEADGQDASLTAFADRLLLVPEHTWGVDIKTHLGDYANYARPNFEAARTRDRVDAPIPAGLEFTAQFMRPERTYSRVEASWDEQRGYVRDAVAALPEPLRRRAQAELARLQPEAPVICGEPVAIDTPVAIGAWRVVLGANGALRSLVHAERELAGDDGVGSLRYQSFSAGDYARFLGAYNMNLEHRWCSEWALPDFGKPGLSPDDSPSSLQEARVVQAVSQPVAGAIEWRVEVAFPAAAHARLGAPERAFVVYRFAEQDPVVDMDVQWFDKPANRMPEALWFGLCPRVADPPAWRIGKLGGWVSPLDVVPDGNRNLHGQDRGLRYAGADLYLHIDSTDAPLVAPGRPRLLEFDNRQPELSGGWHFNLFNNIWGTNFPMWCGADARFRFALHIGRG